MRCHQTCDNLYPQTPNCGAVLRLFIKRSYIIIIDFFFQVYYAEFCNLKALISFLLVEFRPCKGEGIRQPVIGLHDNLSLTKGLALGFLLG